MPLGKNVQQNVAELYETNKRKPQDKKRGQRQMLAIAYEASRRK